MSKVYILYEQNKFGSLISGIISNRVVAEQFEKNNVLSYPHSESRCRYTEFELDSLELLNRIAKESENKNAST